MHKAAEPLGKKQGIMLITAKTINLVNCEVLSKSDYLAVKPRVPSGYKKCNQENLSPTSHARPNSSAFSVLAFF